MAALLLFSCNEKNDDLDLFDTSPNILLKNSSNLENYRSFDSFDEMYSEIERLSELSFEEQIAEEKNHNFISANRLSEEIDLADEEIFKPYSELSEEELEKLPRRISELHEKYSYMFVVDTLEDGSLYENLNIYDYNLAKVVNKDFIVKIGGKIYQFNRDVIKIIDDGSDIKISSMKAATVSDANAGISIQSVGGNNNPGSVVKSAEKTNGPYKVIIYNTFNQKLLNSNEHLYATSFKMTFRVLKKYFGKWYLNHKAIINFDIRYFGNTVQGYRFNNQGIAVNETHSWSDAKVGRTNKKEHTLSLWHKGNISNNIKKPEEHYNTYGNLPCIYNITNRVTVRCSSNRTISFNLSY